jgi:hypothetical protein
LQVLDRGARAGAQTAACGDATLSQQEKNNSADEQKNRVDINSFISADAR